MNKGRQYKISVVCLFLFLLFIGISIKPIPRPTDDGEVYYKIATDYRLFLKGQLGNFPSYLHRDRVLPAVTAGVIADIFKIPVSVAFQTVALVVIALFYLFTWYLLSQKVTNIMALTGFWLAYTIHSYPITWNLFNVYQLTDSMTYLWTVLIIISLVNKKLLLFIPISFLAIVTKQNLWFLVLPGYIFFLRHYFRIKDNKKITLTLVFGLIISAAILLMFFTEAGNIKKSISFDLDKIFNLHTYQGRGFRILKEFFWIYLPILPIILVKYKAVCKKSLEYFPLLPFFIVSIVVVLPQSLLDPSMDFYLRIMQPVVWPMSAYIIVLIVNDFERLKNKYFLWVLYLAPILFGVAHLSFYTISFKPLFIFPTIFRHFLTLFLILVYGLKASEIMAMNKEIRE